MAAAARDDVTLVKGVEVALVGPLQTGRATAAVVGRTIAEP